MKWLVLITLFSLPIAYAQQVIQFSGKAYTNKKKDKLAYIEKHTVAYKQGIIQESLTKYFNAKETQIAFLNCNYTKNTFVPECIFEDFRSGQKEITTHNGKIMQIEYSEEFKAEVERSSIDLNKNSSASQGLLQYIIHLNKKDKDSAVTNFIFPSRAMDIELKIKFQKENKKTIVDIDVNNFLLKMFTTKITMTLDSNNKLIKYFGNSNIATASGEKQNVYIEYFY